MRSNVSPSPLPLEDRDDGVALRYLDGRVVEYRGPIQDREPPVHAALTYAVHVLVTDPDQEEGIMVYVNDYDTSDAVLKSTGVGRILLEDGGRESIYPGVETEREGERVAVEVDPEAVDGRVYVFVENQLEERAYRLR